MNLSEEEEYELSRTDTDTEAFKERVMEEGPDGGLFRRRSRGIKQGTYPVGMVIMIGVILLCFLATAYGMGMFDSSSTSTVTQLVIEKGHISTSRAGWTDVIYTADQEVFVVKDNVFAGVNNAQDTYNEIQAEHTYNMTVIGWDIPVFHLAGAGYRNVIQVEEVG